MMQRRGRITLWLGGLGGVKLPRGGGGGGSSGLAGGVAAHESAGGCDLREDGLTHSQEVECSFASSGGAVNVARFLSGRPDCFAARVRSNQIKDVRSRKVLRMVVNVGAGGAISPDTFFARGACRCHADRSVGAGRLSSASSTSSASLSETPSARRRCGSPVASRKRGRSCSSTSWRSASPIPRCIGN